MIIDFICHLTRTVNVVTNAKQIKFGMIIGVIHVKLIIMVIFVLKMEKLVQDGVPAMVQFIHITMPVEMRLALVELVDTKIIPSSPNDFISVKCHAQL